MLPLAVITGLGKTVLLLVAGLFVGWAIVTAIFIPRRSHRFPRDLNLYLTITAVLFVAQMGAVWWVTNTQDVEEERASAVTETGPEGTVTTGTGSETTATPAETTGATETASPQTETGTTETAPAGGAAGDPVAGKQVFVSAGCGGCHTLADAGSGGAVGPNLDQASPSADKVVERVTNGKGVMPSFKGQLSEQQIADVAAYVSSVTES